MATTARLDPRSESVSKLHRAYARGRLNIFVGAGMSQQSGFPGWDALNKELVLRYLSKEIGTATPAAMLASERLASKVDVLYEVLGRDAAADFVQQGMKKSFGKTLAQVLFNGRTLEDIPLKSAHHQIAALSDKARLFTLNFDPLLELALAARFPKIDWTKFRSPNDLGHSLTRSNKVEHLHGWINTDGKMSQDVILTQSDYFELSDDRRAFANKTLKKMLTGDSLTLTLGMSLADSNFRRFLYFLNKEHLNTRKRIYVVMKRENPAIDHYMQAHWGNSGLRLLFIERYDEIPGLLRDIQWSEAQKSAIPKWTNEAIRWRSNTVRDSVIFTDAWQEIAHRSLKELIQKIRNLFGIPLQEKITASLFIPFSESKTSARLRMVASSRKSVDGDDAFLRATKKVLSIVKGAEQGIAGVCYSSGTERSVAFGEGQIDVNFTPDMARDWISNEGYRDWRSIVAVPIIDSKYWVPVAVVTMTSNLAVPFWNTLGEKQYLLQPELYTAMRQAAYFALVGFASR